MVVDPKARYFPGHSSEMEGAQPGEAAKAGVPGD
jgi:hypothetical protein